MWNLHFANRTKAVCVWTFGKSHPVCDFYCLTVGNRVLDQTKTTCKQQLHTKSALIKCTITHFAAHYAALEFYSKRPFLRQLELLGVDTAQFLLNVRDNMRSFLFWGDTTVGETKSTTIDDSSSGGAASILWNWRNLRRRLSKSTLLHFDGYNFLFLLLFTNVVKRHLTWNTFFNVKKLINLFSATFV